MTVLNYLRIKHIAGMLIIFLMFLGCQQPQNIQVQSPDGKKIFSLIEDSKKDITFSIKYDNQDVVLPSILKLISKEINFSGNMSILKVENSTVNNQWYSNFC